MSICKTDAPDANRGRQLERVGVPGHPCGNRQGRSPPVRAAKKRGTNEKAADQVR